MGFQLPNANIDLTNLSIDHLNVEQQIDLARFERLAHRIYPSLPDWLHQSSSIYAMYIIFAGILVITLLCYYTTLESVFFAHTRSGMNRSNNVVLLVWDVLFTFLSYQILTS